MKDWKKWFCLVFLLLGTAFVIISISGFFAPPQQQIIQNVRVENSATLPEDTRKEDNGEEKAISIPTVSADKLFSHVQRLNFTRHTPPERSRTRAYILSELKKSGWKPQLEKFSDGVNIFAERLGTDKEAGAILVAAHYDTVVVSPGADDNASGVAVVLEIARLLGSRPTLKTLQLAFFDQEEAGLLGSKAYVTNKEHLKNLHGAIVMDMVGYACHTSGCQKYPSGLPVTPIRDKGDFLAVVGDAEHLSLLSAFERSQNSLTALNTLNKSIDEGSTLPPVLTLPIPLKGLLTPDTLRSDHAPFWYQGIGAVLVTDTANLRTPHYHQPSDVPATIDRSFFAGAAQLVVNATTRLLETNLT
jgi:Peptidase family M28